MLLLANHIHNPPPTMKVKTTAAFDDQKPGTSGLRKAVKVFQQPHYLENFVQSIFDCLPRIEGISLALGGDGRFFNDIAIQTIVRMCKANGVAHVMVGQNGIMSTPAASHIVRHYQLDGALILSASHNPGGPDGDFGIKFNVANGGPAPESLTNDIYTKSKSINHYKISEPIDLDLSTPKTTHADQLKITVFNTVDDYVDLLEGLFDFDLIEDHLKQDKIGVAFDAMHAVTGPYAQALFKKIPTIEPHIIMNATPLPDLGGGHPDPSLKHAKELAELVMADGNPAFGAASDGDGDRNMIVGENCFVMPSDSLAILAANATLVPAYKDGIAGVARSMPTSCAVDRVAKKLNIPCYETPTGWKFFGNLLDAGKITLCGEESFGTSSNHVREKDGLWAVMFWLNLLAAKQSSVKDIVHEHWAQFGRNAYLRHDYEAIEKDAANTLMETLVKKLHSLKKTKLGENSIKEADEFTYQDPIDNSISEHQGIRILLDNGSRIIYRLSGTGTQGATLRVYLEAYTTKPSEITLSNDVLVQDLATASTAIAEIEKLTGREQPSVIT